MKAELESSGFVSKRHFLAADVRARLLTLIEPGGSGAALRHPSGRAYAVRNLLAKAPLLRSQLDSSGVTALASAALGGQAFPIDATYFDKCAAANWTVPGHQDRVLPVASNPELPHRVRAGISYAQLDPQTLAELIALRLHFDATDAQTGALRVVPGSHVNGTLSDTDVRDTSPADFVVCPAEAGDVFLMRPLLLHRSSPFQGDGNRRVLHVVYASRQPHGSARWRELAP